MLVVNVTADRDTVTSRCGQPDELPLELQPRHQQRRLKTVLSEGYYQRENDNIFPDQSQSVKRRQTFTGIRKEKDLSFDDERRQKDERTEKVVFNNMGPIDKMVVFSKDSMHQRK